jgi:hypothetical protein
VLAALILSLGMPPSRNLHISSYAEVIQKSCSVEVSQKLHQLGMTDYTIGH